MIATAFDYNAPASLTEALALLADGSAKALAGGMSLIPIMKLRLAQPEMLIDLRNVADLKGIEVSDGAVRIGAMTTHYEVESSAALRVSCPLLSMTASNIGDVQVRNMGTIGGSAAHNDPAADYPAALQALEAEIVLANASRARRLPVAEFFVDTLTTALEPGEIITEISVAEEAPGTGVSYQKMLQPASGYAVVGVAARIRVSGGKISFARIGVTGLAPNSFRATRVENLLLGTAGTALDIQQASAEVAAEVDANSDIHASADYRKHCARVYCARAIAAALSGAR